MRIGTSFALYLAGLGATLSHRLGLPAARRSIKHGGRNA
jgi:hypothetical protein